MGEERKLPNSSAVEGGGGARRRRCMSGYIATLENNALSNTRCLYTDCGRVNTWCQAGDAHLGLRVCAAAADHLYEMVFCYGKHFRKLAPLRTPDSRRHPCRSVACPCTSLQSAMIFHITPTHLSLLTSSSVNGSPRLFCRIFIKSFSPSLPVSFGSNILKALSTTSSLSVPACGYVRRCPMYTPKKTNYQ